MPAAAVTAPPMARRARRAGRWHSFRLLLLLILFGLMLAAQGCCGASWPFARGSGAGRDAVDAAEGISWFSQISDLHLSIHKQVGARARDVLDLMRLLRPELIAITGDLTDGKSENLMRSMQVPEEWRMYSALLDELAQLQPAPEVHDVPGNHDAFAVLSRRGPSDNYGRYSAAARANRTGRVRPIHHGGILLVALDLAMYPGPNRPFHLFGHFTHEILAELDAALDAPETIKIVFGHFPTIFHDTLQVHADTAAGERARRTFLGILRARNVTAFLNGHTHRRVMRHRHDAPSPLGLGQMLGFRGPQGARGPWEVQLDDWKEARRARVVMAHPTSGRVAVADFDHAAERARGAATGGPPLAAVLPVAGAGGPILHALVWAKPPPLAVRVRASRAVPGLSLAELNQSSSVLSNTAAGDQGAAAGAARGPTVPLVRAAAGAPRWSTTPGSAEAAAQLLAAASSGGRCELEVVVTSADGAVHVLPPQECWLGAWDYETLGLLPRHGSLGWTLGINLPMVMVLCTYIVLGVAIGGVLLAPRLWLLRAGGAAAADRMLMDLLKPAGAAGLGAAEQAARLVRWAWWGLVESARDGPVWWAQLVYSGAMAFGHWVGIPWFWARMVGADAALPGAALDKFYGLARIDFGGEARWTAEPLIASIPFWVTSATPALLWIASQRAARRLRRAGPPHASLSEPVVLVGWWALQALALYGAYLHGEMCYVLYLNYGLVSVVASPAGTWLFPVVLVAAGCSGGEAAPRQLGPRAARGKRD